MAGKGASKPAPTDTSEPDKADPKGVDARAGSLTISLSAIIAAVWAGVWGFDWAATKLTSSDLSWEVLLGLAIGAGTTVYLCYQTFDVLRTFERNQHQENLLEILRGGKPKKGSATVRVLAEATGQIQLDDATWAEMEKDIQDGTFGKPVPQEKQ